MTLDDIEEVENERCAAMVAGDLEALNRLFSEELIWAHASGKVDTKAEMLAQFREGSMACYTIARSDIDVRLFGDAAVVTGIVTLDAMVGGVRKKARSRYAGVWSAHRGRPQLVNWLSARLG